MARHNLNRYRGDTSPFKFEIKDAGEPFDISGYTFKMTCHGAEKPDVTESNLYAWTRPGVITDAANGEVEVTVTAEEVDRLGVWWYDLEMTSGAGVITTPTKGRILWKHDVQTNRIFTIDFADKTVDTDVQMLPWTDAVVNEGSYPGEAYYRLVDTRMVYSEEVLAYFLYASLAGWVAPYWHFTEGDWTMTVRGKFEKMYVIMGMWGTEEYAFCAWATPGEGTDRSIGWALRYLRTSYPHVQANNYSIPNAPGWWWLKMGRFPSLNKVRAKAWEDGQSEPDWQDELDVPYLDPVWTPRIGGDYTDTPFTCAIESITYERVL